VSFLASFAEAAAFYSHYAQLPPLQNSAKQSWIFILVDDGKLCEQCDEFRGEAYQIEDQSELEEAFPYGEQLDKETFSCNIHPNCRCIVERQE
jgi:hypothetical protein